MCRRGKEHSRLRTDDALLEFYRRLKNIKDHDRRFNAEENAESNHIDIVAEVMGVQGFDSLEDMLSVGENWGKYLELTELYQSYINMKGIEMVDFVSFLRSIKEFDAIPDTVKRNPMYSSYLSSLAAYLKSFLSRAQPLLNVEKLELDVAKKVALGMDTFSETIKIVYCDPCQRAFANQNVYAAHLSGKKHKNAEKSHKSEQVDVKGRSEEIEKKRSEIFELRRGILSSECLCEALLSTVSLELTNTIQALERKQTLTLEEYINRVDEEKMEIVEPELVEKTIEEKFSNPLKLPLGWDGKPIPYWLYKLHGLGVEYPCEICGNFVYMGRRAFQRHFKDTRHSLGMRNLGIPNSKEFKEITKIEDALESIRFINLISYSEYYLIFLL